MNCLKIGSILLLFTVTLFSCNTDKKEIDTSNIQVNIVSEDLDKMLFQCKSREEVSQFLRKYPEMTKNYFTDFPGDSAELASQLFGILQNPDFNIFKTQLDSLISDRKTNILDPLTSAFKRIKYHYPDFPIPKVQFIVTGFLGNDLYISDSLIIIGLDYFGGPTARYRPNVFDYQLTKYQKEYIVPSIVFFESNRFNQMSGSDKSLLSDMVAYGKGYQFVQQIMPDVADSVIVGYSRQNLERTYNSQQEIWNYLVASKSLYENSELKKRKFIEERPFTTEIGEQVPGAIGRWVGWRIVDRFVKENPDVSLVQLMAMDNAPAILQESGYSGQKDEDE